VADLVKQVPQIRASGEARILEQGSTMRMSLLIPVLSTMLQEPVLVASVWVLSKAPK
jgi:hypothetical protein